MANKTGIVRFLGTNCDRDIWQAVEATGGQPEWLWYEDLFYINDYNSIIIPGGFSYGDYVRAGALAARSKVMASVREAVDHGIPVLGICNGFQVLCESGLLEGALVQNESRQFIEEWSELELDTVNNFWGKSYKENDVISLPIAHGEGRFYAPEEQLKKIEDEGTVWWRYKETPNGSLNNIAGIMNKKGNVAGLMPHPERALFDWMQGEDGLAFFN